MGGIGWLRLGGKRIAFESAGTVAGFVPIVTTDLVPVDDEDEDGDKNIDTWVGSRLSDIGQMSCGLILPLGSRYREKEIIARSEMLPIRICPSSEVRACSHAILRRHTFSW